MADGWGSGTLGKLWNSAWNTATARRIPGPAGSVLPGRAPDRSERLSTHAGKGWNGHSPGLALLPSLSLVSRLAQGAAGSCLGD